MDCEIFWCDNDRKLRPARRCLAQVRAPAMVQTQQAGQAVFGSVLPENSNRKRLPAFSPLVRFAAIVELIPHRYPETAISDVFYIGLGDRFDDDRRRVRVASS